MNDTSTQMVQPPPHDLPAPPAAYAGWTATGLLLYVSFIGIAALGAALWHEVRGLRRSADALLAKIAETRASLRPEARR